MNLLASLKIGGLTMGSINVPKRFTLWSRIEGDDLPGKSGRRYARLWPAHEHREVDVRVLKRCGVEHGFEGVVVGLTVDCETNQLAGLMIREREVARLSSAEEIELDRILGLRDPVYHRLILGSHAAIDSAVVRTLALAATNGSDSARRTCATALGRFVERREVSLNQISRWLEDVDAGALMHDPAFSRGVRVV